MLEEHAASADGDDRGAMPDWDSEAFLLAAPDRRALADRVQQLRQQLARECHGSLKDLAYTLNAGDGRPEGTARLGLVAAPRRSWSGTWSGRGRGCAIPIAGPIRDARGIYFWEEPLAGEGCLAFLFPGEGSQYPGMLADLCPHFPEVRAVFDTADRIALESGEAVPPSRISSVPRGPAGGALVDGHRGQRRALRPVGDVPGAVPAGPQPGRGRRPQQRRAAGPGGRRRHPDRAGPRAAARRLAAIFRELEANGAIPAARLVAVGADRDGSRRRAEGWARRCRSPSTIARTRSSWPGRRPRSSRSSRGSAPRASSAKSLPFARAYHTPSFASVLEPLDAFYASLELHPPGSPSTPARRPPAMPDSPEEIRRLAVEQWTRPVAFRETIEAMYGDGLRIFVDVGARGNLCGFVEDILRGRPAFAIAANLPRRSGTAQLNHLVASLFAQGLPIDAVLPLRAAPAPPGGPRRTQRSCQGPHSGSRSDSPR